MSEMSDETQFQQDYKSGIDIVKEIDAAAKKTTKAKTKPTNKTKKTKQAKKAKNGNGKKIAIGVGSVVAALCLATVGYTYLYPNIHFGVNAGTVEIGGMSITDAQKQIEKSDVLDNASLPIKIYQTEYKIGVSEVANGLDSENSAKSAYEFTRTGGFFTRIANTMGALFGLNESKLSVNVNDEALKTKLDEISAEAITEPVRPILDC